MKQCDVLVAGAGPAGCAAAIAAAREGAKVLLVELGGMAGGMGTAGLVPSWAPFSDGVRLIHRGIGLDVLRRASGRDAFAENDCSWHPIHAERLKAAYDDMLEEAGVQPLFFALATGAAVGADGRLESVTVATKAGLRTIRANIHIDATGDGDLAALAGVPFSFGDDTGTTMPATLCFRLGNVRWHAGDPMPNWGTLGARMRDDVRFERIRSAHCIGAPQGGGVFQFNAGHLWDVDGTRPESLSDAMREGRRLAAQYAHAFAALDPARFGDAQLLATAPMLGLRESRRIAGEYVLTQEDYFARRTFADQIACNAYPIDIHQSKAEARSMDSVMERFEKFDAGESHGIPLGSLLAKGCPNLLLAGRCISCDRVVQGSIRVMPPCLSTGEAAGCAAGLAAVAGSDVREVPFARVRERLLERGAYPGGEVAG